MYDDLCLDDLKSVAKDLTNGINFIRSQSFDALSEGIINNEEFLRLKDEWGKLEICELEFRSLIAKLQLDYILNTNILNPRSRIEKATNELKAASEKIDEVGAVISEFAKVISMFAKLILAIKTGGIFSFPS
jgi:hypothetical protein